MLQSVVFVEFILLLRTLLPPGKEEEEEEEDTEDSAASFSCKVNEESGHKKIKVLLLRQEPGKPEVNEATDTCLRYGAESLLQKETAQCHSG